MAHWISSHAHACLQADRAGGQRAEGGARDLRVDVAVEDVVIGAAGAAHGDSADDEQGSKDAVLRDQSVGDACENEADEAGQAQQPEACRAVIARQLQVGPRERRGVRDPAAVTASCGSGGGCGFGHAWSLRGESLAEGVRRYSAGA